MTTDDIDTSKRRFLTLTTSVIGALGSGVASVPFILSMQPSARAQAAGAPVEADISKLEPGGVVVYEWRGNPVWIVRRTEQNLKDLQGRENILRDPNSENEDQQPEYAVNKYRSRKPEYLVLVGICTHLGCSPKYRPDMAPADLGKDWVGGFFCPCHGSRFDLSGRVYASVPAPSNLVVPPHYYISDSLILIGEHQGAA